MTDGPFKKVYRVDLEVRKDTTLVQLENTIKRLRKMGMQFDYKPTTRYITITIPEPGELGDAPQGTHEFAKGWITRDLMGAVKEYLGGTFYAPDIGKGWAVMDLDRSTGQLVKVYDEVIPCDLRWKRAVS